ncbi:glycosyltransferase family 39 protein [Streptomyces cyaneofuscatus]
MSPVTATTQPTRARLGIWHHPAALLPVLLSLVIGVLGIRRDDTVWHDEAATLGLAGRSLPELWQTLGNIDAVHGLYYLLMHGLFSSFGTDVLVLRLPSVLATAVAVHGVALLGTRLASRRVGLIAALVFAVLPDVQRYAQEGRSYALVCALVVWASYLLVLAVDRPGRTQLWMGYGALMLGACLLHEFAVLAVAAHAVAIPRTAWRPWGWAAGGVVTGLTPLAVLSVRQSAQVAWVDEVSTGEYWSFGAMAAVGLACGILVRQSADSERCGGVTLTRLAVPLLIAPTGLLMGLSLFKPLYVERYVLYGVAGLALLLGAGADRVLRMGRLPVAGVVAASVAACVALVPASVNLRTPESRSDNVTDLANAIAREGDVGDSVIYLSIKRRAGTLVYPLGGSGLGDLALAQGPDESRGLYGTEIPAREIRERILENRRVLAVREPAGGLADRSDPALLEANRVKEATLDAYFTSCRTVTVNGAQVTLYARDTYDCGKFRTT